LERRQGAGDGILVPVVAVAVIALAAASLLIFRRPHVDAPASLPSAPARRVLPSASPRPFLPVPRPSRRTGAVTTETTGAPPGLTVEADVPGADVFVDREYKGKAPIVVRGLVPGAHHLNVAAEGFDGYSDSVEVTGKAQTVSVRLKDVTLDVSVDVVHRHALGSCRGRLYATPAGLRYRAAKGDDSFDVPLAGIEEIQVDYAKKNLRVRLHGGRTYNFNHAEGNVDALLGFAQAVDKARKKLEEG
jgi:PEGA domain-containing protein